MANTEMKHPFKSSAIKKLCDVILTAFDVFFFMLHANFYSKLLLYCIIYFVAALSAS